MVDSRIERGRGDSGGRVAVSHGRRTGTTSPPFAGVHDNAFVEDEDAIPQSRSTALTPNQSQAAAASGGSASRSGEPITPLEIVETEQKTPGNNPSVANDASDIAHTVVLIANDSSEAATKLNDTTLLEQTAESIHRRSSSAP